MMTKPPGLTIAEIGELYPDRVKSKSALYWHVDSKDFPEPEYRIGRIRIYDRKKVARYFANRTDRRLATA